MTSYAEVIPVNSTATLLAACRPSAQHDQVSWVIVIGSPIYVRELKIDLHYFCAEKGKS
jgi:hypothetical protein